MTTKWLTKPRKLRSWKHIFRPLSWRRELRQTNSYLCALSFLVFYGNREGTKLNNLFFFVHSPKFSVWIWRNRKNKLMRKRPRRYRFGRCHHLRNVFASHWINEFNVCTPANVVDSTDRGGLCVRVRLRFCWPLFVFRCWEYRWRRWCPCLTS